MFTKILYINLDRRTDRKKHIENELNKINWSGSVERINAVDGRQLTKDDLINLFDENAINEFMDTSDRQFAPGSYMSKGAAGCALSHKKCWENIYNGNDEKVLILEDDIRFDDNFNDQLKTYLEKVPDYDILYIGFHEARGSTQHDNILQKPGQVVFGLFGYIVNKRIAKKLIDMFPIRGQIDSEIAKIYDDNKVYHLNENSRIVYSDHSHNNTLGTDIQLIETFVNKKYRRNNSTISNELFIFCVIILLLCFLLPKIIK